MNAAEQINEPIPRIDFAGPLRRFQWLKIFRSVVYALDPQMLLLAAAGLILVASMQWMLFGESGLGMIVVESVESESPEAIFRASEAPIWPWTEGFWRSPTLFEPWNSVVDFTLGYTQFLPVDTAAKRLALLVWTVLVWSFFGGMMCRIVALRFAREQYTSFIAAAKFTAKRLPAFLTPAGLVAAGVLLFWTFTAITGLIARIPWVGPWVSAIFMIVPLVCGFLIGILVIAWSINWPIYHASIATEGSDGFEGFSRPLNLIVSRPLYGLWTWLIALLLSSAAIFVVAAVISLIADLTKWGYGSGAGSARADAVWNAGPSVFHGDSTLERFFGTRDESAVAPSTAEWVASRWLYVFASVAGCFGVAHFWSCATVIYFLLRRREDSVEFREIYLDEPKDETPDDDPVLAGVAAGPHELEPRPVRPPEEDSVESQPAGGSAESKENTPNDDSAAPDTPANDDEPRSQDDA